MTLPPFKPRTVICPTCRGPSVYAIDNAFRPFCSARCKNNDFGAWASESYRVGTKPDEADDDNDNDNATITRATPDS